MLSSLFRSLKGSEVSSAPSREAWSRMLRTGRKDFSIICGGAKIASYSQKWEYVRQNPLRAGLIATQETWPYQEEIVRLPFARRRLIILRFRQLRAEPCKLRGDVLMRHGSVHEIFVSFFLDLFAPDFAEERARSSMEGAAELRA
jgi:hypothetical protein